MGNVRYTKSDCEGARSVGERLVFAVHPVGHIAAQHNIGCLYKAAESVQTTSGPPCCHGVAEAMGAGAMATGREREKAPATPTDQPGLGREEAKKSPVCDLIAEGRGRGKFARRPDHRGTAKPLANGMASMGRSHM